MSRESSPGPSEFGRGSVARRRAPAHGILLPGVKLDLAVLLLWLACLWFAVSIAPLPGWLELPVLAGGSMIGALWLVWRTRRALAALSPASGGSDVDGEKQE